MGQTDFAPVFLIIKVEYEIRKPFADSSLKFTPVAMPSVFAVKVYILDEYRTFSGRKPYTEPWLTTELER